MNSLVAVFGTLLGALVGVLGSYLVQRYVHRSETDERLGAIRREAYLHYLSEAHALFTQISEIHRKHAHEELPAREARGQLHAVSAADAQTALEGLRLVGTASVAANAANLHRNLRSHAPARGDLSRDGFRRWRQDYWLNRRAVINAAREDLGFAALDWMEAGVGQSEWAERRTRPPTDK